ncbi:MAG: glycosyl transferase [Ilumatobacter coccineus]|uniref:Glycosyl transferase n=1 Tax=Ilumatobacter coccineus TaxID=467094 RepID=A0A2G6KH09_9ACTN|nr:MAG: glycosyl transferase [Ilumatobacter coccineus]
MKLVIQIPCFNEEATLAATLADLPREVDGFDAVEWLVINDGSTDRTVEVAHDNGVDHVISHHHNRGLAAAFLTGLDAALAVGADVVVNTDADNQYAARCIPALTAPVLTEGADMVIGERPIEHVAEFSRLKKRLQRVGSWVVRRFSGTEVRDAASGFRAFSRHAALRLQVFGKYSYTMETLVQARAEGLHVVGVPIEVNPATRPSRLAKSMVHYVRHSGSTIVRSFALYYPFRFFFLVGLVPFLAGFSLLARWLILWMISDPYVSRVPSLVIGAVLTLVAVQIWVVGFLGDLQAATRRLLAEARARDRAERLGS